MAQEFKPGDIIEDTDDGSYYIVKSVDPGGLLIHTILEMSSANWKRTRLDHARVIGHIDE